MMTDTKFLQDKRLQAASGRRLVLQADFPMLLNIKVSGELVELDGTPTWTHHIREKLKQVLWR